MEASNLPEFKTIIIRMFKKLREKVDKLSENYIKRK